MSPRQSTAAPAHTPYAEMGPEDVALARLVWARHEDRERLLGLIDAASFTSKAGRALFLVISKHADAGLSPVTLGPIVADEAPVARALLERLMGRDGTVANEDDATPEALAESLAAHARVSKFRRSLQAALTLLDGEDGYDVARGELERQLTSIDLAALTAKPYDDKADMARRAVAHLDGPNGGLPFGYVKLDRKVAPMLPGNFVVVAGRPSTGKSMWLRNFSRNAVKRGEPVAYFSLEMTGEEKLPLFACMDAGVPYVGYVRRTFTESETQRFIDAMAWWVKSPLFTLNERSSVTPEWLLRTMRRYRAAGVRVFVIDHLHRIRYTANGKGEIRLAMAEMARELKSWAVDNGAIVLAGAQLTKGDKHEEPDDGMIREAGQILDEADKIFLVWRQLVGGLRTGDGSFIPTVGANGRRILARDIEPKSGMAIGEDPSLAWIKIGKQRIDVEPEAIVPLPFNHETGVVADLDTRHMEIAA